MSHVVAFVGIALVVICTPGPDTALIVRNTLFGGRTNGVRTAAGVVTGLVTWTVAASAGVAALIAAGHAQGVEFGPGKVLQGLVKRISREAGKPLETAGCGDLAGVRALEKKGNGR